MTDRLGIQVKLVNFISDVKISKAEILEKLSVGFRFQLNFDSLLKTRNILYTSQ